MSVLDTLRDLGGCSGGIVIYKSAKELARIRNINRKNRKLKPETICRLKKLFPNLDLNKVRFKIHSSLPGNWYTSADNVDAMTFGYTIYFKGSDIQKTDKGLSLLIHELVHVNQVMSRGDSET
ncbi:MAG: DUF4157 domain-containing protein, partial [Candidatus Thiodiazotropha taylori]